MKSWYHIKNQSATVAELSIFDDIGAWGKSAKDFLADLKAVGDRQIKLRINSGGGNVFDAIAIHNLLKDHAAGVETYIDGVAASAATIVALGGKTVNMAQNALFMIHKASGVEFGNADTLRDYADILDKVDAAIVATYQKKTGKSGEEIQDAMSKDENWFSADEAKAFGFVDNITEPLQIAAHFDMSRFHNAPKAAPHSAMNLRSFLITALKLTDPADQPLADEAITAAFTAALTGERQEQATAITALRGELDAEKVKVTASDKRFSDLTALLKPVLELGDEQITNLLTDHTVITAAVDKVAGKKAVALAAAQGVPPVLALPVEENTADNVQQMFTKADAEPDPLKRAQLFAAASQRLMNGKASGNN